MIKISENYELYKDIFLGKGSSSIVYKGKYIGNDRSNLKNGTDLAIKVIKYNTLSKKSKIVVEDEIKTINIIKNNPHPNIVECYDVIRIPDKIFFVMELCDSGDLRSILKKPIKEKFTQFYFSQLANGLRHLDRHKIIHRDIKPRNILLTNNRRVLKIADFGFAKKSEENTLYDTVCGSPLYMAPEIMTNNYYNKQTDLWSIGMILFEMLYGFHPFQDCKSLIELRNVVEGTVVSIPPSNTDIIVSNECLSLLRLLLQKEVGKRISWENFFSHEWLNIYQYILPKTNKKNEDYEKQICSISLGSLDGKSYKDKLLSTPPNLNNYQRSINKSNLSSIGSIRIIDNYCDGDNEYDNDDDLDDSYANEEHCIFTMDDDELSIKNVISKCILEKSSILNNLNIDSQSYEIVDKHK